MPPLAQSPHNPRRPLRDHVLWILAVGLALAFAVVFLSQPEKTEWHRVYFRAALRMRAHQPVNVHEAVAYAYPPAMAFVTVPLTYLPLWWAMFVWYAINMAAAGAVISGAWALAGGPRLARLPKRWLLPFYLGLLFNLRFTIAPLQHQQFDMVIAAALFLGCLALWRGRDLHAGVWLGAAAAMKLTPLLFMPYLVWRKKFLAAGVMLAVATALNLLPDAFFPQDSGRPYVRDWLDSFAGVAARSGPGAWFTDPTQNQSLAGTISRWFAPGTSLAAAEAHTPPESPWVRVAVYGVGLALLLATIARCGRPFQPPHVVRPDTVRPVPFERLQVGMEAAAGVCLMLLISPMSGKAHFVVMLLPVFLIMRMALVERSRAVAWLLIPLALCGPLTTKGLWGTTLGGQMLFWGLPTGYVLTALVCMWIGLGRVQPRP